MMRKLMFSALVFVLGIPAFSSGFPMDGDAREILQRALKAAGGERALARLKGPMLWMEKGMFYGRGDGGKLASGDSLRVL